MVVVLCQCKAGNGGCGRAIAALVAGDYEQNPVGSREVTRSGQKVKGCHVGFGTPTCRVSRLSLCRVKNRFESSVNSRKWVLLVCITAL